MRASSAAHDCHSRPFYFETRRRLLSSRLSPLVPTRPPTPGRRTWLCPCSRSPRPPSSRAPPPPPPPPRRPRPRRLRRLAPRRARRENDRVPLAPDRVRDLSRRDPVARDPSAEARSKPSGVPEPLGKPTNRSHSSSMSTGSAGPPPPRVAPGPTRRRGRVVRRVRRRRPVVLVFLPGAGLAVAAPRGRNGHAHLGGGLGVPGAAPGSASTARTHTARLAKASTTSARLMPRVMECTDAPRKTVTIGRRSSAVRGTSAGTAAVCASRNTSFVWK